MHVLAGTWIANIEKSTRHENHRFANATMRFVIGQGEIRLSYKGVNASDKVEQRTGVAGRRPAARPSARAGNRRDQRRQRVLRRS